MQSALQVENKEIGSKRSNAKKRKCNMHTIFIVGIRLLAYLYSTRMTTACKDALFACHFAESLSDHYTHTCTHDRGHVAAMTTILPLNRRLSAWWHPLASQTAASDYSWMPERSANDIEAYPLLVFYKQCRVKRDSLFPLFTCKSNELRSVHLCTTQSTTQPPPHI